MRSRRSFLALLTLLLVLNTGVAHALPRGTKAARYKRSLNFPVDMAWVKGTRRVFFTEKNTGKVRVLDGRRLRKRACVNLNVNNSGERGALGIALHPNYKRNHKLYVFYTKANPLEDRVKRYIVRNRRCKRGRTIVGGLDASSTIHHGGQLEFMRHRLFVSVGDAGDAANAQSIATRHGKVLRLKPNGSVPRHNPFRPNGRRSAVWSYGQRNPFGLTHEPGTGRLFETENGPECDDELNRIRKGRNYGWGNGYSCGTAGVGPKPKAPLHRWSRPIVPTDPWWYEGRMGRLSGDLYIGDFRKGRLHRYILNRKGTRVRRHRSIFNAPSGILDVSKGPGGWLYFVTKTSIKRIVPR
jgi:aldose sugar dehydrogenase